VTLHVLEHHRPLALRALSGFAATGDSMLLQTVQTEGVLTIVAGDEAIVTVGLMSLDLLEFALEFLAEGAGYLSMSLFLMLLFL